jgi:hypothetical protein
LNSLHFVNTSTLAAAGDAVENLYDGIVTSDTAMSNSPLAFTYVLRFELTAVFGFKIQFFSEQGFARLSIVAISWHSSFGSRRV